MFEKQQRIRVRLALSQTFMNLDLNYTARAMLCRRWEETRPARSSHWQKRRNCSVTVLPGTVDRSASPISGYLCRDTKTLSIATLQYYIKWNPNNFSLPENLVSSPELHVIHLPWLQNWNHTTSTWKIQVLFSAIHMRLDFPLFPPALA